jgi:tight adherence protein B
LPPPAAPGLAFAAAVLGLGAWLTLWPEVACAVRSRAPRLAAAVADAVAVPARAGRDGRAPALAERRRLASAAVACGFGCGWFVGGALLALAGAAVAPVVALRAVRASRARYRRAVDAGAAAIATALADALSGGHSVRGAIGQVAEGVGGPAGAELRRTAGELGLGAGTDEALEAMRARVGSHGIDTVVAACLLQRSAGGDLARLLRDCARALEDHARLEHDARAATAQARFTGLIVVLLPLGGALLAELASPGYLARLSGSFMTAWLGGMALAMQVAAAALIRRLGRVRP